MKTEPIAENIPECSKEDAFANSPGSLSGAADKVTPESAPGKLRKQTVRTTGRISALGSTIDVAAAVIRRDGKVLICSRPPGKPPAGWEFPGGKIEPGENPAEALRREIAEELALDVIVLDQIFELTYAYPDKTVRLHFLRALLRTAECAPHPCEGQQCQWMEISRLNDCGLLPADRPLAEFLQ